MSKADYEAVFEEFWREIVCRPGGSLDEDAVKRELHDYRTLLREVPLVYDHVTGGRVTKPNTCAAAVIEEADENYRRLYDESDDLVDNFELRPGEHDVVSGEALRARRQSARLSQEDLAWKAVRFGPLNITQVTVSLAERGRRPLSTVEWYQIDAALRAAETARR